ncbi:bifunctional hydroxymethylpyrimidine kinase/phosphomethylpyrimidine kinase [Methanobrevibacter sp. TMH8]|uniref:bifunctional hydroxymethylpyrimidine kinase/phosphomethylpyrimidine kinase n=1 Tax=Methanobrevibacter sp. TMH8 TaxID=2848611 RepID=UPI001CCAF6EA|nr:bifunctional hydroxymethylpyrimidine kinase/phosphomethylpyrimidine kinase [Methanobrevibacter sp. TMH8]MBZ9570180.1 bifunctional hydroxymethylpyrimidine kinase/phosphomethylpyrimidine kinase [Methanobrevibacter sp. TMH8]
MIGISIAGFDPSGGAGIIADMKTFSALEIHGTAAITALTAQNPTKVFSLMPISIEYIEEQIDSIFDEYGEYISYGKTGMLYSTEIIKTVGKKIKEYNIKVVVDPVMVASAGGSLLKEREEIKNMKEEIATSLKKYLLPHCLIATPNIHEAEIISGIKINNTNNAIEAAYKIGEISNVIITGGHLDGINTFFNKSTEEIKTIKKPLIETSNVHGTGCSFSAALAGYSIKGNNLTTSIEKSLDFVELAVKKGKYGTLKQPYISD